MLQRIFFFEFFRNPFFWWAFGVLILTTFHGFPIVNLIMQQIIINTLYNPVLFICLTISFFLAFYPVRKSIRELYLKNQKEAYVLSILICTVILVNVAYFLSDAPLIFSKIQPQMIGDKEIFEEAIDLKMLMENIAIPLLYAYTMTLVKNHLLKENLKISDKFRNNLKFGTYLIIINTPTYFLYSHIVSLFQ